MRSKRAAELFHKGQVDCGTHGFYIEKLREIVPTIMNSSEFTPEQKEHARDALATAVRLYNQASDDMKEYHPIMMAADQLAEIVQGFLTIVVGALVCVFLFPWMGAVTFAPGILPALLTGLAFGVTMKFLFQFAMGVQIVMGAGIKGAFGIFVLALWLIPMFVIGVIHLTGFVVVTSLLWLAIAAFAAVIITWLIPPVVRNVV